MSEYDRLYYQSHKVQHNETKKKLRKRNLLSWLPYLPKIFKCEICGKRLNYFSTGNFILSVFFDHKNNLPVIKGKPKNWLMNHYATSKNVAIWKSCDFGILCLWCNLFLPTKGRNKFLKNIVRYIKK